LTRRYEITNNGNTRILRQNNNIVFDEMVRVKQELNCLTTEVRKREKRFNSVGLADRYIRDALDIERRRGSKITHDLRMRKEEVRRKRRDNHKPSPSFGYILGHRVVA